MIINGKFKLVRTLIASLILFVQCSFIQTAYAATKPYWGNGTPNSCSPHIYDYDRVSTASSTQILFDEGMFAELESQLDCLMDEDYYFLSGESGTSGVALFYEKMFKPYDPKRHPQQLDQWLSAKPDSEFARFAKIRIIYNEAWHFRGSTWAKDTPVDSFSIFHRTLEDAQDAILEPTSALQGSAVSAHLLLVISLDMKNPKTDPFTLYSDAASRWPEHHSYHRLIVGNLVPRWGGSFPLLEHAISSITENNKHHYGERMYAMLYRHVHNRYHFRPDATHVDWPRLKTALNDWVHTEVNHTTKIIAASYACFYNDMDMYERYRPEDHGHYIMLGTNNWVKGTDWNTCETKLSQVSALP